ncbi:MAG: F0F1 ATP synthase subunit B [Gemmatimonadota bacterium]|nr:F0F1 ATP synthase subunit B [Gemmatimonadota bacterium]
MDAFLEPGSLLSINPGLIFWTCVTFVILLMLLKKFVWGPIIDAVDRREQSLKDMFDGAERAKDEARQILENYEKKLSGARGEVNEMIEDGKARAGKSAEEIIGKADSEANRIIEAAKAEIGHERQKAVEELKAQVVKISLTAAGRLIERSLAEQDHRDLIEQTISEIDKKMQ